jgi:hypothetical protein
MFTTPAKSIERSRNNPGGRTQARARAQTATRTAKKPAASALGGRS